MLYLCGLKSRVINSIGLKEFLIWVFVLHVIVFFYFFVMRGRSVIFSNWVGDLKCLLLLKQENTTTS
jgi:hypothetical protein